MNNKAYDTTYMTDTETGFTYTCLKGEVATKIKLYPTQKEITEQEYNKIRGIGSKVKEISGEPKGPTNAELLKELVELDPTTELNSKSTKADLIAALELIKESQNN